MGMYVLFWIIPQLISIISIGNNNNNDNII